MCEWCDKSNTEENLRGSEGIIYDKKNDKHYLFIEHFHNEINRVEVKYCPECGNKL
jgi:hypothetical protein